LEHKYFAAVIEGLLWFATFSSSFGIGNSAFRVKKPTPSAKSKSLDRLYPSVSR
jgi:hypothetical protein